METIAARHRDARAADAPRRRRHPPPRRPHRGFATEGRQGHRRHHSRAQAGGRRPAVDRGPEAPRRTRTKPAVTPRRLATSLVRSLAAMQRFARDVRQGARAGAPPRRSARDLRERARLPRRRQRQEPAAVDEPHDDGRRKPEYVHYGSQAGLGDGSARREGPRAGPARRSSRRRTSRARRKDATEYWHCRPRDAMARGGWPDRRCPRSRVPAGRQPARSPGRALVHRPDAARYAASSCWSIVRILDDALNNTSVILLFEVGGKRLLFPGDAQIENWRLRAQGGQERKPSAASPRSTSTRSATTAASTRRRRRCGNILTLGDTAAPTGAFKLRCCRRSPMSTGARTTDRQRCPANHSWTR